MLRMRKFQTVRPTCHEARCVAFYNGTIRDISVVGKGHSNGFAKAPVAYFLPSDAHRAFAMDHRGPWQRLYGLQVSRS